jgi:glycosyltransferase involved in cell wall biosynthesis
MELWSNFPHDSRVGRASSYLVEEGHEVTVISKWLEDRPIKENLEGVEIIRPQKPRLGLGLPEYVIENLTLIQPRRYRLLSKVVKEEDPDILHVHDLEPIRTGLRVAHSHDLPVVLDLHELYPEYIAARRRRDSFTDHLLPSRIFKTPDRYKRLEKRVLENEVSGLVTVSPEQMEFYEDSYDLPDVEKTVIRNVPDVERLRQIPVEQLGYDGFVVGYIGNFNPHRGLETIIEGFAQLLESAPDSTLLMVGDSYDDYADRLKQLCVDLGISEDVEFTGWVDFERVPSYINACDVTHCLFKGESPQAEYALPNKLFQSMFMGTPVVVSDLRAMRNVVEETESGLVFERDTPSSLAEVLLKLHDGPELRERLGENGKRAVEDEYNFRNEAKKLVDMYEKVRGV